MKNHTLILGFLLTSAGLSAFGLINWGDDTSAPNLVSACSSTVEEVPVKLVKPTIFYSLGSRFEPITKSELERAASVMNFLPAEHSTMAFSYGSVSLILIENDQQSALVENGKGIAFNERQINFLRSMDYSGSFAVKVECYGPNSRTGVLSDNIYEPHFTVVPEKQATHSLGNEGVLDYLRMRAENEGIILNTDALRPSKLYFTVTANGELKDVRLDRTSGSAELDMAVPTMITEIPGTWTPAENAKGEKVEQVLVVSLGAEGC